MTQKMLIPAYFYPGSLWTQLAGAPAGSVVIMNPASGPGLSSDPNYVSAVAAAQGAGLFVIGYVDTNYAAVLSATAEGQIDDYKSWYGVDGIFLDRCSALLADETYYSTLATYIRGAAGTEVVLNPGTIPDVGYMAIGDLVVLFEDTDAAYQTWVSPPWAATYAAKIAHLVHTTPGSAQMAQDLVFSRQRSAAAIFVTDDVLPNPWDTLPSFWSAEISLINQGDPPMSLAEGVSAQISYKAYSAGAITANTLADTSTDPGASGAQVLRRVSSTLTLEKNTYQSAEIRSDRQIVDFRHGTQRAAGKIAGEFSAKTYFDFFEAINRDTKTAGVSLSQSDLTSIACASAGTITFAGGDPIALGLGVGMVIRTTGNTVGAGNDNVNFIITGFSGSSNRIVAVTPPPVNSTASTTFTVVVPGHTTKVPSTGFVSRKFGIEVFHEDLNLARLYTECRLGGWAARLPATGMATIDFDVMGRSQHDTGSGSYFTSPTAATTTGVFAAVNGELLLAGTKIGVVTAADMAMSLKPEAADVVGQNFAAEIFLGRADLTGTLTAYLQDNTIIDDFVNESELQLLLYLTATSAANTPFATMFVPRLKLSSASVNLTGEAGQQVTCNFQGLKYNGAALGVPATTFQIHDSEA